MFRFIPIVLAATLASARAADAPDFNRDVRPILSNNCFKCHGPDDKARKGKLRLDLRDSATQPAKSGETAIVGGKPDESELLKRIGSTDDDEHMPPPATKKELTAQQKDILKRWIASGAKYDPHWAFVPPKLPAVPKIADLRLPMADWKNGADGYGDWSTNPIDGFVLKRLADEKLMPSRAADNETLCRRLYFDLIGLPPMPEEVDDFLKSAINNRQSAIASLADKLMASPHYGERWARKWLDLARYADTNGYEKDRERSIWPWRDWVINALNADLPFDQFTIEQLAGDLLPGATPQQIIATGFHRNTMLNEEGGIDPLEFRFHAMTDRLRTTGKTWLGLTVECAQCHTHKFDPITHREYYQIFAFLNNADEPDYGLPDPDAAAKQKANEERAAKLLAGLGDQWPLDEVKWDTPALASIDAASGEKPKLLDDHSALFAGPGPDKDVYTIVFDSDLADIDRLRLETLVDPALPSNGPGRVAHGNFVLTEIVVTAAPKSAPDQAVPVKLVRAESDVAQPTFPAVNAFDGDPKTGWAVQMPNAKLNANHTATFGFEKPVNFPGGTRFTVRLEQNYGSQHTIGRPRLSVGAPVSDGRPVADRRREIVEKKFAGWLERERARTVAWTTIRPFETKTNSPLLTVESDGSIIASGDMTKSDAYELKFRDVPRGATAIRLEVLADDRLPNHGPGRVFYEGAPGDFFLSEFTLLIGGTKIPFAGATHSFAKDGTAAVKATDGDQLTGWSIDGGQGRDHEAVFRLGAPLADGEFTIKTLCERYYASALGRFRISVTTDPRTAEAREMPAEVARLLTLPDAQLTAAQRAQLREQFLFTASELASVVQEIRNLRKPPTHQTTLVMRERPPENPRPTFIHNRGEYLQPTDRVEPGVLAVLNPLPADGPRNRLAFARWLVSPENPLTARVAVNRAWAGFFGRGIVKTVDDFGYQGDSPTHPELLDYLATSFATPSTINDQRSTSLGWSMKRLHRLIVTSAAYQQSSRTTPEVLERDPENILLARGPRVRLEAEMIRDSTLRIAGLLTERIGGPSVRPPQPAGATETAYGGATWTANEGPDRYRRSLYTFSKRTAPFAMYTTFDGPAGDTCIARRDVSDTPLQALTALNDIVFIEAAQALGKTFAALPGADTARLTTLFRRFFARAPHDDERALLTQFLKTQRERFTAKQLDPTLLAAKAEGDPAERAAWTALARALLNTDETVTKG